MKNRKFSAIIACDPKGVMGKRGQLPWDYPEDKKHFLHETLNHITVMGYKTFLNLSESYFDERISIVFSRLHYAKRNNVIFVASMEDFLKLSPLPQDKKYYVIGGAEICRLFFEANLIDEVILTMIEKSHEGDVFFPLECISKWSRQLLRETDSFSIYRYMRSSNANPNR